VKIPPKPLDKTNGKNRKKKQEKNRRRFYPFHHDSLSVLIQNFMQSQSGKRQQASGGICF
jgi:hypothetical protein